MANVDTNDLLDQVFAAPIHLAAVKSQESQPDSQTEEMPPPPPPENTAEFHVMEDTPLGSRRESVHGATEDAENPEKAEELHTVGNRSCTTRTMITNDARRTPTADNAERFAEELLTSKRNFDEQSDMERLSNILRQDQTDEAEEKGSFQLKDDDQEKEEHGDDNKTENYEAKAAQEMEFLDTLSDVENVQRQESRTDQQSETMEERESRPHTPQVSERTLPDEEQHGEGQQIYVKTDNLQAIPTGVLEPEKVITERFEPGDIIAERRSSSQLEHQRPIATESRDDHFQQDVPKNENESIHSGGRERNESQSMQQEQRPGVKHLMRLFAQAESAEVQEKKTVKKHTPERAWIHNENQTEHEHHRVEAAEKSMATHSSEKRSSIVQETSTEHSAGEARSREVSISSKEAGNALKYQNLHLPAGEEKFQSVRVVKNVRQFVKSWGKIHDSDVPEIHHYQKHGIQTAEKRRPIVRDMQSDETKHPTMEGSRRESVASQHSVLQNIPEQHELKDHHHHEEVIIGEMPVSQRKKAFEASNKAVGNGFTKTVSATNAKTVAATVEEEIPKPKETSASEAQVTEANEEGSAPQNDPKSELEKLSSIEERRRFFERQSKGAAK